MLSPIYYLLPLAVLGDMCADFCRQKLGHCEIGSYCKTNRYCHSLFWTNETNICLFTGEPDCQDHNPVSCEDAANHLLSLSPLPVDIIDILPTRRNPHDSRPYVRIEYRTQSSGLAFLALLDTSSSYSLVPVAGELGLYMVFASMLDSPSFDQVGNLAVRPARNQQRYIDGNRAQVVNEGLTMNVESDQLESCRVIRESARLHSVLNSTFSFNIDIVLTRVSQPYHFLLGASRDSDFARAAGVFGIARNQLVIGPGVREYILGNFCTRSRFRWIPSEAEDWIINGTNGANVPVRILIDTGEQRDGYSVTREVFTNINETLVAHGAVWESSENYSSCSRSILLSLPSIEYGIQNSVFTIHPEEYLEFEPSNSVCRLRLFTDDSSIVSFGPTVMTSLAIVLDNINSRIGLCFTD
jgi:hypothetical protein